jgi:hypothetical protein
MLPERKGSVLEQAWNPTARLLRRSVTQADAKKGMLSNGGQKAGDRQGLQVN